MVVQLNYGWIAAWMSNNIPQKNVRFNCSFMSSSKIILIKKKKQQHPTHPKKKQKEDLEWGFCIDSCQWMLHNIATMFLKVSYIVTYKNIWIFMCMIWNMFHTWYQWLSAKLQYLHCISSGDTAVLHWAIDIIWYIPFIVYTIEYTLCMILISSLAIDYILYMTLISSLFLVCWACSFLDRMSCHLRWIHCYICIEICVTICKPQLVFVPSVYPFESIRSLRYVNVVHLY